MTVAEMAAFAVARRGAVGPAPSERPARSGSRESFRTILHEARTDGPAASVPAPWVVPPESGTLKGEAGLRWAAGQLEAWLWSHLLQQALKPGEGSLFGEGMAGQVYGEWFCQATATLLVDAGPGRLARLLVDEFSRALTGDHIAEGNRGEARGVGDPVRV